jgi:xylulokinase
MSENRPAPVIALGIDLGTSAVKIVALGANGRPLGETAAPFETTSVEPGQAEQAPLDWLQAAARAMQALGESLARAICPDWSRGVAAIGLTGQLPTLVCLDDRGPVGPAITWKDGRADAWAAARIDPARRASMYAVTGMPIDGRYLAPMLQYHFAERRASLRRVLSAKDYLLSVLTGLELTEPSTAAGFGVYDLHTGRFNDALCDYWDLPASLLPGIRAAMTLAGPLSAQAAEWLGLPAGIPVSIGGADSACAAYAMAGLDERSVSISFGSSAVVFGSSRTPRFDPAARYLLTPHVCAGWYGREMDLLASGTGYRWLSDLFGWASGQIDLQSAHSAPGAHGLVFPPYLAGGEQGALWNPRLAGALIGLNLRHTRADVARAYLEGLFFEIRRCIEVLAETVAVTRVAVSGNVAGSATSLQLLADVLNRPVLATPHRSAAAVGAARLALESTWDGADARSTHAWLSSADGTEAATSPNPATAATYAALYSGYLVQAARCAS